MSVSARNQLQGMTEMAISEGKRIVALIKASSVLLAVKQPGATA